MHNCELLTNESDSILETSGELKAQLLKALSRRTSQRRVEAGTPRLYCTHRQGQRQKHKREMRRPHFARGGSNAAP